MCRIQVDTHSKTRVRIPARDYDINRSESDMACHYSNSRMLGVTCVAYDIAPQTNPGSQPRSEPALELNSWVKCRRQIILPVVPTQEAIPEEG